MRLHAAGTGVTQNALHAHGAAAKEAWCSLQRKEWLGKSAMFWGEGGVHSLTQTHRAPHQGW